MNGLFEVLGKIANWLPKKEEHLRNEIQNTKEKMDKLLNQSYMSKRDRDKYESLADKLRNLEKRLQNRA